MLRNLCCKSFIFCLSLNWIVHTLYWCKAWEIGVMIGGFMCLSPITAIWWMCCSYYSIDVVVFKFQRKYGAKIVVGFFRWVRIALECSQSSFCASVTSSKMVAKPRNSIPSEIKREGFSSIIALRSLSLSVCVQSFENVNFLLGIMMIEMNIITRHKNLYGVSYKLLTLNIINSSNATIPCVLFNDLVFFFFYFVCDHDYGAACSFWGY